MPCSRDPLADCFLLSSKQSLDHPHLSEYVEIQRGKYGNSNQPRRLLLHTHTLRQTASLLSLSTTKTRS